MDYLISIITSLGNWGYVLLFIIIFLESFPFTFFLPGDSLLFTTGFLASAGHLNFPVLLIIYFIGGTGGYIFSYLMGKRIRDFILASNDRYWFKKKHIEYTEGFYAKYGAKTLIIGRFVPIVRSFAPTLAGAVDMAFKRFIKYTLVGGLFWTLIITSAGFYLGKAFPSAHLYLTPIILGIIFVSLLPTVYEYFQSRKKNEN